MSERSGYRSLIERLLGGKHDDRGETRWMSARAALGLLFAAAAALTLFTTESRWMAVWVVAALACSEMGRIARARPGVPAGRQTTVTVLGLLSEALVVAGAAWRAQDQSGWPGPLAAGFLALAGALMLGYARPRIRASAGMDLPDGPYGLAGQEARLLIIAVGVLLGEVYWALLICAALAHLAVSAHLVRLRVTLHG